MVTLCNATFNIKKIHVLRTRCVYFFGWISDQTTLTYLFSISRLLFRHICKITKSDI